MADAILQIMTKEQLSFIKTAQREYKERFGAVLHIDFPLMNGIERHKTPDYSRKTFPIGVVRAELRRICLKHKVTIEQIADDKGARGNKNLDIRNALTDFAVFIYEKKYDPKSASELVDKHRTTLLYHYNRTIGIIKRKKVKHESKGERQTNTDQLVKDS